MIDKLVEEQIQLFLKYSKDKGISMEEYIKIRQQTIKEINMGVVKANNTTDAMSVACTTSASSVKSESEIKEPIKENNFASTNTNNKVISIKESENRRKEEPYDDKYLLQILKSVKE